MYYIKCAIYLVLVSGLFITSCGSDDEDISGTYRITSYANSGCDDPALNLTLDISSNDGCTTIAGQDFCGSGTVTLNSDDTFSISVTISGGGFTFSDSGSGSFTLDGNTFTVCDGSDCFDGSLSGDRLTIVIPTDEGCILTITANKE